MGRLELSDGERAYLLEMRALSTDRDGNEVFVGLTLAESIELIALRRADLAWRLDDSAPRPSIDDRQRYLVLDDKNERARFMVLGAEHELRVDNPTRN